MFDYTSKKSLLKQIQALVTCHHMMCYGNERFLQSCASRTLLFSLQNFDDRSGVQVCVTMHFKLFFQLFLLPQF